MEILYRSAKGNTGGKMISRELFLQSLLPFREYLTSAVGELEQAIIEAHVRNPWFYPEFTRLALQAIADEFLDPAKCAQWLNSYTSASPSGKRIGLIMAGNIPLVGFHDLFCVLASGHHAVIKLSEKDSVLPKFILDKWKTFLPEIEKSVLYTDKLEGFDAVIATGSNNSARYFEYYFRSYPHILRRNRNGIAILTGEETQGDLQSLGKDIFLYYGLGCRNVSKLFVPQGYDFTQMEITFEEWNYLADHIKYRHNLDYNYAIYIVNKIFHINLGHLILKEDDQIASRIGCVHYSYYGDMNELKNKLEEKRMEIQCLVSCKPFEGWEHILPGYSQYPSLDQYADGVDTMQFLSSL